MIKAVIFDMDGTMLDTDKLWGDVNSKLATSCGVVFDEIVHRQMIGKKDDDCLLTFKEYFHLNIEVEELVKMRRKMVLEDVGLVRIKEGLYELLDLLDRLSIKKAMATSAFGEFAHRVISSLNLEKRFDTILVGEDVTKGKPDPEIFLKAAERLGVDPSECLVLEDAENGVLSAHRANIKVFVIPHPSFKDHDFSKATKVLSSMLEIDEAMLKSL
jgi:HAD superfamily hydrolase (TIGR01509 family)